MSELDYTHAGQMASMEELLAQILHELRRPDVHGVADEIDSLAWPAGGSDLYVGSGSFAGFVVVNESDSDVYVALSPNQGAPAGGGGPRPGAMTLEARGWIALPIRGNMVSVGGAAAGTARVIPLSHAPNPAFGTLTGGGSVSTPSVAGGQYHATPAIRNDGDGSVLEQDPRGNLKTAIGWQTATAFVSTPGDGNNQQPALWVAAQQMLATASTGAYQFARTPNVFKPVAVSSAAEITIWTPAAGKKFRLMGWCLTVDTTADTLSFRDNTAGTIVATIRLAANAPLNSPPMGNGILSAAVNNVLTIAGGVANNLRGFVFGTEE